METSAARTGADGAAARPRARRELLFRRALVIAFALHLPFVPLRGCATLFDSLTHHLDDYDAADAQALVPVDLDLITHEPEPEAPAVAATPPPAPPARAPETLSQKGDGPRQAPQPTPARPSSSADAGPPPKVAPPNPIAAAGAAGKISAKDPNVQVLIASNVLRKHPIGAWVARMLVRIPEWRGFFKDSPIDPVRDLNHVLITAPRLYGDSSDMVVVADYNVAPEVARGAIDLILHQTGGVWLDDAPVSAAKAKILGVQRLFAHVPDRKLLVVLPASAQDQLAGLARAKGFRNSSEAVVISMVTPARPLRHFLALPETLKWLRVAATPTADQGADVVIDVGDRTAEEAVAHARIVTDEVEKRRVISLDLGFVSTQVEAFDKVVFAAEGDVIHGKTHIHGQQLTALLSYIEGMAKERERAR